MNCFIQQTACQYNPRVNRLLFDCRFVFLLIQFDLITKSTVTVSSAVFELLLLNCFVANDNVNNVHNVFFFHVLRGLLYSTYPHDDVTQWKHFPLYWPFVRGIHRSPVNSPNKGQWRAALMYSLICARTNVWANHRDTGDLRRHRAHYEVTVMRSQYYNITWLRLLNAFNYIGTCSLFV